MSNEHNGTPSEERVLCPAGEPGTHLHYVSPAELAAHKGACAKCFARIKHSHRKMQDGRREDAANFESLKSRLEGQDHVAFVSESHDLEGTIDFDFDAIDDGLLADELSVQAQLADAFREILEWIWHDWKLTKKPESAFMRFVAMSAVLRPELVGDLSYEQIGAKFGGLTKQAVSKNAVNFSDRFKIHLRRSRRSESRAIFRQAQLGHPPTHTRENHRVKIGDRKDSYA